MAMVNEIIALVEKLVSLIQSGDFAAILDLVKGFDFKAIVDAVKGIIDSVTAMIG